MMHLRTNSRTLKFLLPAALLAASPGVLAAEDELKDNRTPLVVDFTTATYLPKTSSVLVAGLHGLLGALKIDEKGVAKLEKFAADENIDFTAVERLNDGDVLLGTANGKIFDFDGEKLVELATITKFDDNPEPVLDIAVHNGKAWAAGGRGMLAKSEDGKKWELVEIEQIEQPETEFPGAEAADWYFGASNVIAETVKFQATKGGKAALAETDYVMYPDEGFINFASELDASPPPKISFMFKPGPAFKQGDVSWNVVLFNGSRITLAGEFGMIVQSLDGGSTWVRRDAHFTPKEPEPPYWMGGTESGDTQVLVGAAGAVHRSTDGGATWTRLKQPSAEGLFGVALLKDGTPVIAGAVGMIGTFDGTNWTLADRTKLQLLSWLKNPVDMPDGSLMMLGGRQTIIHYKDGNWTRVPMAAAAQP